MSAEPEQMPGATLVIFGASGDLSRRLLMPALANLLREDLLGEELHILGVACEDLDDEELRARLDEFVGPAPPGWERLRRRIMYLKGAFEDDALYREIGDRLDAGCNAAFYLATPPEYFGTIVEKMAGAHLLEEKSGFRRMLVEKPFGHDLASARVLNKCILSRVGERQVYRIDHFLGKETVQNILVARFANPMIEAVWNNRYVDHVQITAARLSGLVGAENSTMRPVP